jgi:hypothetical protein
MVEKGYHDVKDVIGGLKPWTKEGAAKSRESRKGGTITNSGTTVLDSERSTETSRLLALNAVLVAVVAILICDRMGMFAGITSEYRDV